MPLTINLGRRRPKAPAPLGVQRPNIPIGEIGQTVFACPVCGRPLVIGERRCPGCGTRLIMGVQARRASVFIAVGVIFGIAVGGGLAAFMSAVNLSGHDAEIARNAAAAALARASALPDPSASPVGSTPSQPVSIVTAPALSASALSQAILLDTRLTASSATFQAALANHNLDVLEVSQLLRNASADAVLGIQLAASLNSWPDGSAVAGQLTRFYAGLQSTAADGLVASIRNDAAYRRAATAMVKQLKGLAAIDAQARALATSAGIPLPAGVAP